MATKSNEKLREEINALDVSVDIEGLTNKELVAKLKELKASELETLPAVDPDKVKLSDEGVDPDFPKPPVNVGPIPAPITEAEEEPKLYHITKGKSLTSPRGILSGGDEVRLSDYEEEVFNNLLKKGYIE